MSNKLQGKDFINIGIFTVIYFVVTSVVAMLGVIPVFIPLLCVFVPLIGGIPMMLYFSKIRKFGMLTITGVLDGVLLLFTGMGYWCILTGLVFGLIADFMLKSSGYKKVKMEIMAHGVFSISVVGAFSAYHFDQKQLLRNVAGLWETGICRCADELYAGLDSSISVNRVLCCWHNRRIDWT